MIWFLLLAIINHSYGFIGYDCGSRYVNITTLSLLEVGKCEIPEPNINVTRNYVQLLQIIEYSETKLIQVSNHVKWAPIFLSNDRFD